MDTKNTLTNNSNPYTTNVNLGVSETLMGMFLSVGGKKTDVVLRYHLNKQMMDVTLHEEPSQDV